MRVKLFVLFCFVLLEVSWSRVPPLGDAVEAACNGDLALAYRMAQLRPDDAGALHVMSAISLMQSADAPEAVRRHLEAKRLNPTRIPPLAELHLNKKLCGGLSDVFYVSAVIIKQLVDSNSSAEVLQSGLASLVTLTADSGLHDAAENIMAALLKGEPSNVAYRIRSALLTPGVFESNRHITRTRELLSKRLDDLVAEPSLSLSTLDEFVLSPTFYFVYQGFNDKDILGKLHSVYAKAYPAISAVAIPYPRPQSPLAGAVLLASSPTQKVRIGFVSSYFRRHSVCKLFCGLISGLDRSLYDVFVFSSLPEKQEDDHTAAVRANAAFIRTGMTVIGNRDEVTRRNIHILVYLDVGMQPSTVVWAGSRLAPIQVCLWGHPTTTSMLHMDYFLSADSYHREQESALRALDSSGFSEQLVRLDALGFYFRRPQLDSLVRAREQGQLTNHENMDSVLARRDEEYFRVILASLKKQPADSSTSVAVDETIGVRDLAGVIEKKMQGARIVLCPQHLPKFHPSFDIVLNEILYGTPNAILVLVYSGDKKGVWRKTLETRWKRKLGIKLLLRVAWLDNLTPQEYLALMAVGDVMIDPFPFGGGVTSLEAMAVCTPVITAPNLQTVPGLTAGMIHTLGVPPSVDIPPLIVNSTDAYIKSALALISSAGPSRGTLLTNAPLQRLRNRLCHRVDQLYEQKGSVVEWNRFFAQAAKQIL